MRYEKIFQKWYSKDHDEPCAFNNKDECRTAWTAAEEFFLPMLEEVEAELKAIRKEAYLSPDDGHRPMYFAKRLEFVLAKIKKMKGEE